MEGDINPVFTSVENPPELPNQETKVKEEDFLDHSQLIFQDSMEVSDIVDKDKDIGVVIILNDILKTTYNPI